MGASIDTTRFRAAHKAELDTKNQALWTFAIKDRKVNIWGRYADAAMTAQQYAEKHGVAAGPIQLVDCTGAWQGVTLH